MQREGTEEKGENRIFSETCQYGISQGSLAFSKGKKKMVVGAADGPDRAPCYIYRIRRLNGPCSFYIHSFLIDMVKNYNAKETVLVITVGFLLLFIFFKRSIFLYSAAVLGSAGAISSYLSEKIDWAWNKLAFILGEISNRVLLALLFFFVVTPVGLVRRLWKKNRLTYFNDKATSNFSDREHKFVKKDMENPW